MCVFCLHMCMYHVHTRCPSKPEEDVRSQELKLQMVMSAHEGAGNQSHVL